MQAIPLEENSVSKVRESTGIPKLDEVCGGGLLRPSDTVIIGTPGCGTTTFCKQFIISSLLRGKKVVAICADESREYFLRHFNSVKSFDVGLYLEDKRLIIVDLYMRILEHLGIRSLGDIDLRKGVPIHRIIADAQKYVATFAKEEPRGYNTVLDSITAFAPLVGMRDVYEMIRNARSMVKKRNRIHLVTAHEGALEGNIVHAIRQQADNVIRMRMRWVRSELKREMIIEKMTYTEMKQPVLEYTISDTGIEII